MVFLLGQDGQFGSPVSFSDTTTGTSNVMKSFLKFKFYKFSAFIQLNTNILVVDFIAMNVRQTEKAI